MEFKRHKLDNGLQIVAELNPSAKSAAVGLFIKTGARDEPDRYSGISHFLEHMIFKGTERLDAIAVNEAFDRTGAHFNAFTTEENTVYYAAVLPEYLEQVTALWIELMRPALRSGDLELERQVILQEIAMYKDQPDRQVLEQCRSLHYDGHPCGKIVIGTDKTVSSLTADQIRSYLQQRYVPNNMIVAFAGNLDWDRCCGLVEASCSQWQSADTDRQVGHFAGTMKSQWEDRDGLSCEHICLMHQAVSAHDQRRFMAALLASIVGDDTGSRYYWHLVDNATALSATMQYWPMDGTGALCSYLSCRKGMARKVLEVTEGIFEDLYTKGIGQQELERAKNKIISALVIRDEVPMGRLIDIAMNWLYLGQYRTIEQEVRDLRSVTVEDINRLIKELDLRRFTSYVLRPANGKGN
jgi:predicted Zn-dependent peptidase